MYDVSRNALRRERSPRILLADDDAAFRALVATRLRREGYEVTLAASGDELLEMLASAVPAGLGGALFDLIVSDIRMPGRGGLEILAQMPRWAPHVILMTAFGSDKVHAQAKRLGAIAILDKPFDLDDLLRTVRESIS